jgi:sugar phosphate isomerase/epimerase
MSESLDSALARQTCLNRIIVGRGSVDFPAFFRVLEKNNYAGWMVLEQDVTFGATLVPPVESVAASLKYLLQASAR